LQIETSSTIYEFDGRILVSTLKAGRRMSLMDAVENAEARQCLNLPQGILFLMDVRALSDMSIEAIVATVNAKDLSSFSAAALLVSSTVHEIIAREGKRFSGTTIPVKTFMDIDEARKWLEDFPANS